MKKLMEVKAGPVMQSGIAAGLAPVSAPLWADGRNILFKLGQVEVEKHGADLVDFGDDIHALAAAAVGEIKRLYAGSQSKVYMWDEVSTTVLASGFSDNNWTLIPFGTWLVMNNGVDRAHIWKNSGTAVPLNATWTRAKVLVKWGPYLIAANTSNGKDMVEWCSDDAIEDWVPLESNTAGNMFIRDITTDITAGVPLGNAIALYTENEMQLMSYTGDNNVFSILPTLQGIGACSSRSVVSNGRANFGLQEQGIWVTDGVSIEFIDIPNMNTWIKNEINWEAKDQISGYFDETNKMIWWNIPLIGSYGPNARIGVNYESRAITVSDVGYTFCLPKSVFKNVLGIFSGAVKQLGLGNAGDSWVRTKPLDCGNADVHKIIQACKLTFTGQHLRVRFGWQEALTDEIDWTDYMDVENTLFPYRDAVYITLEFRSTEPLADWQLNEFSLHGIKGGLVL